MTTVYVYRGCSTCMKALKWLAANGVEFTEKAIRETPPKQAELKRALVEYADGNIKKLCNTSGQDYRASGMKDRIAEMSDAAVIKELAANGNMCKRPLLLAENGCLVGFKEPEWQAFFNQ